MSCVKSLTCVGCGVGPASLLHFSSFLSPQARKWYLVYCKLLSPYLHKALLSAKRFTHSLAGKCFMMLEAFLWKCSLLRFGILPSKQIRVYLMSIKSYPSLWDLTGEHLNRETSQSGSFMTVVSIPVKLSDFGKRLKGTSFESPPR